MEQEKKIKITKIQIEFIKKFNETDSVYVGNAMTTRTIDALYYKKLVSSYGGNWWHLTETGKELLQSFNAPK